MAKRTNPRLIGAFVVGAMALTIVGILAFGGGQYFAKRYEAVMFFQGSLSGLAVGSPVEFRGVKVGSVTSISIQYDVARQDVKIPVYVEIFPKAFQIVGGHHDVGNIENLVQRGLRAHLQLQSLVTGQSFIEFEFRPETPIRLVGAETGMPELPTVPSSLDAIQSDIVSVLGKIAKLPLDEIAERLLKVLDHSDHFVATLDAQIAPLSTSLMQVADEASKTLVDARRLVNNVNGNVGPLFAATEKDLKDADGVLGQADKTLIGIQHAISPDSALVYQVDSMLKEIKAAAADVRGLASYLERNPNALLTGKRP